VPPLFGTRCVRYSSRVPRRRRTGAMATASRSSGRTRRSLRSGSRRSPPTFRRPGSSGSTTFTSDRSGRAAPLGRRGARVGMLVQAPSMRATLARARASASPASRRPGAHRPGASRRRRTCSRQAEGRLERLVEALERPGTVGERVVSPAGEARPDLALARVPASIRRPRPVREPRDPGVARLPFTCEFCDIIEVFGRVPRVKSRCRCSPSSTRSAGSARAGRSSSSTTTSSGTGALRRGSCRRTRAGSARTASPSTCIRRRASTSRRCPSSSRRWSTPASPRCSSGSRRPIPPRSRRPASARTCASIRPRRCGASPARGSRCSPGSSSGSTPTARTRSSGSARSSRACPSLARWWGRSPRSRAPPCGGGSSGRGAYARRPAAISSIGPTSSPPWGRSRSSPATAGSSRSSTTRTRTSAAACLDGAGPRRSARVVRDARPCRGARRARPAARTLAPRQSRRGAAPRSRAVTFRCWRHLLRYTQEEVLLPRSAAAASGRGRRWPRPRGGVPYFP
jgi:hypothetical protein